MVLLWCCFAVVTYDSQCKLLIFVSALPCCAFNYCSIVGRDPVPSFVFVLIISTNTNATTVLPASELASSSIKPI